METVKRAVSPFRLCPLLRQEKDPRLALQLFLNPNPNPSPKPFRYSARCFDFIICKLGRAKMFDEMEQILLQLHHHHPRFTPKEILFCNVISFYGRARMPEHALRTFHRIPSFHCTRTVKSINSLLNALLNSKDLQQIRDIYSNIDSYVAPDACTYNILIKACCLSNLFNSNNPLNDAWNLFSKMRERGIRPNVVTFGTLIDAMCENSMLGKALKLEKEMKRVHHVKPNAFVYTSLIKGLCKNNELDLAFKLKDKMVLNRKVGLDSAVYSTLIRALFRVGRNGEVVGLLEEMRRNGCKPDTVTYNALIAGFCSEKNFDSAFGVLNEMAEKGCRPDVFSYNVIISALRKNGQLKEAIDLFEDMPRRECFPDVVSYRLIFDGLSDGMEFKEAAFILDEMLFKGYVPSAISVQKFVQGLCQEGDMELLGMVSYSLIKGNAIDEDVWKMVIDCVCGKSLKLYECELIDSLKMAVM